LNIMHNKDQKYFRENDVCNKVCLQMIIERIVVKYKELRKNRKSS